MFVNFLLRAIDRFLGKGLDMLTILEYLFLNLAWILALSVPMAVLLATLMTFLFSSYLVVKYYRTPGNREQPLLDEEDDYENDEC